MNIKCFTIYKLIKISNWQIPFNAMNNDIFFPQNISFIINEFKLIFNFKFLIDLEWILKFPRNSYNTFSKDYQLITCKV